jgi:hypothetical protein
MNLLQFLILMILYIFDFMIIKCYRIIRFILSFLPPEMAHKITIKTLKLYSYFIIKYNKYIFN